MALKVQSLIQVDLQQKKLINFFIRHKKINCRGFDMKKYMFSLLFLFVCMCLQTAQAKPCEKPKLSKEEQEKLQEVVKNKTIETILGAIDFNKSLVQVNGITGKVVNEINRFDYDVKASLIFDQNLSFKVGDDGTQTSKECESKEKFKASFELSTKNLQVVLKANKAGRDGSIKMMFYSTVDRQAKPLVANLKSNLNASVLYVELASIDINYMEDEKNPNLLHINGNCGVKQRMLNFETGKTELQDGQCYLRGTIEDMLKPNLEYGFLMKTPVLEKLQ